MQGKIGYYKTLTHTHTSLKAVGDNLFQLKPINSNAMSRYGVCCVDADTDADRPVWPETIRNDFNCCPMNRRMYVYLRYLYCCNETDDDDDDDNEKKNNRENHTQSRGY